MKPHLGSELRRSTYVLLAGASVAALLLLWELVSRFGIVDPRFLPSPIETVRAGAGLVQSNVFHRDLAASLLRVGVGFLLATVVAVPLGILAGSSRMAEALLLPLIGVCRYLPAAAFIPLTILWFGIGFGQKVSILFISIFFYLTLMVADVARSVRREWVEAALTLGAKRCQLLRRVIVPGSLPGVWNSLRTMMGVGWTTIIIAELVNSDKGLGARIQIASRFLRTDQIIFVVVVIGLIGLALDAAFRYLGDRFFPWDR